MASKTTLLVERRPNLGLLNELEASCPENPLCTGRYYDSLRTLNRLPWIVGEVCDGKLVWGSFAILEGTALRRLTFPSIITTDISNSFWDRLIHFCRMKCISDLELRSFSSLEAVIPTIPGEYRRIARREYFIDLQGRDLWTMLSSNHRRNVKKAIKAGIEYQTCNDLKACDAHISLQRASMARRGEDADTDMSASSRTLRAYLSSGVGQLFQARSGDEVLSSVLILRSRNGAYYQSAGTSSLGNSCGASQALVHEICKILQSESVQRFSLGGVATDQTGLEQFKAGFGAKVLHLDAVSCLPFGVIQRKFRSAIKGLRYNPLSYIHGLVERVEHFSVYSADPSTVPAPSSTNGLSFEKLSDGQLEEYVARDDRLAKHYWRVEQLGFNDAYGVFLGGTLTHISWLIPWNHDLRLPIRNIKLKSREAEITHAYTLPEYRGQGMYVYAIHSLCQIARERGDISLIYMLAGTQKVASRAGIEKAGFVQCGTIRRHVLLPRFQSKIAVTVRSHRSWGP